MSFWYFKIRRFCINLYQGHLLTNLGLHFLLWYQLELCRGWTVRQGYIFQYAAVFNPFYYLPNFKSRGPWYLSSYLLCCFLRPGPSPSCLHCLLISCGHLDLGPWASFLLYFLFFFFFKDLFIWLIDWLLCWVFVSVLGLSLVAASGATLHRGARASHYRGLSHCGAQAPDAQAQQLWPMGPVAPRHVGSPQTRARTRVPCISRQTLNHCTSREALFLVSWGRIILL